MAGRETFHGGKLMLGVWISTVNTDNWALAQSYIPPQPGPIMQDLAPE